MIHPLHNGISILTGWIITALSVIATGLAYAVTAINPHDLEVVILEWIGVVSAVLVAIMTAITLLWARWRSTMKQLLDEHADTVSAKGLTSKEIFKEITGEEDKK